MFLRLSHVKRLALLPGTQQLSRVLLGAGKLDFGPTLTTVKILVPSPVWPPGYELLALIGGVFN